MISASEAHKLARVDQMKHKSMSDYVDDMINAAAICGDTWCEIPMIPDNVIEELEGLGYAVDVVKYCYVYWDDVKED